MALRISRKTTPRGQVDSKLTVSEVDGDPYRKGPRKTKEVHHEEENRQLEGEVTGNHIGYVRVVVPVKLSYDFQSIGIEVGVELPWELPPGDKEAFREAVAFASDVIGEEIESRVSVLRETLQRLSKARR